ncbi:ABC transporter permease [bacterium SCSIO 12741]|nr:ABC transporter permease [bacterium SCSIO 12741]
MKTYFILAWRNLWRNRRRTLITVSSICFALFFGLMMKSVVKGMYDRIDDQMIRNTTGYVQLQHPAYWDDKNIDNSMAWDEDFKSLVQSTPGVEAMAPKLDYFALVSTGNITKGTAVIGTLPEMEKQLSGMHTKVVEGTYFSEANQGTMVAVDLAKYLKLSIGDTLVLFGQGYHGITAAGKYWVQGIVDFNVPLMNTSMLFIHLEDAQHLFGAEGRLTHVSLMVESPEYMIPVQSQLNQQLDSTQAIAKNWKELNPEYVQSQGTKNVSTGIMIGVLYLIVGFGIFGTLFMMTLERRREFSVMISIGMKRSKLAIVVFIESVLLGIIGVLSGLGISLPVLFYLNANPIELTGDMAAMYRQYNIEPTFIFSTEPVFIFNQLMIIFCICVLLAVVPIISVHRLNFVNALRGR